jgi:hypothetical protein
LGTWCPGGRPARRPVLLSPLATAWHRGEHPRHSPPPPGNAGVAIRVTLTSRGCDATRSGRDHKIGSADGCWEGADR